MRARRTPQVAGQRGLPPDSRVRGPRRLGTQREILWGGMIPQPPKLLTIPYHTIPRNIAPESARSWKIVNRAKTNPAA